MPRARPAGRELPKRGEAANALDFFRQMAAGKVPHGPLLALLEFRLLEADPGRVVFGAVPSGAHYNGMGVVHGGLVAALLDSAMGCAINTLAPAGRIFTTLEIKISYTRPLTTEVGPLRCDAHAIHVGSRVGTAEGRVTDAAGRLYAHGTTTCIVVEREHARPDSSISPHAPGLRASPASRDPRRPVARARPARRRPRR